jgi:hypothetical protein
MKSADPNLSEIWSGAGHTPPNDPKLSSYFLSFSSNFDKIRNRRNNTLSDSEFREVLSAERLTVFVPL